MQKCEDIRGRLTLYLDNELQGDERGMVEAHLADCESCAAIFARELNFLNAVRESATLHVAPPELRAKVQKILSEGVSGVGGGVSENRPRRASRVSWLVAAAAGLLLLLLPLLAWRIVKQSSTPSSRGASNFALMAAETHLRHMRGQLPLETESADPQQISSWFVNKVNFSVKLPNYQESSGQEKLYTLEGARLVNYQKDYVAYVAYKMKERPISLVVTSDSLARPWGGEEIQARGLTFHYNAIDGLKVLTWSDRGLTYALVSDLEERGQQSCIVCHEGTKDRDLLEPLKPH
ncbi:MAG TPA: zf-HC2 domain-containing protein [Pyrinomonadaceae bacterium]|nr:zf-HC2 domain-containing protein [Pyrinomonadaceae bacterium]